MKKGYVKNIEEIAKENNNFRQGFYTENTASGGDEPRSGEEIGAEVHPDTDQLFRIDAGEGKVIIDETENIIKRRICGDCLRLARIISYQTSSEKI